MVFGTLEQLEALMESLGVLIGHCHGLIVYTTDRFKRVVCRSWSDTRRQRDGVEIDWRGAQRCMHARRMRK